MRNKHPKPFLTDRGTGQGNPGRPQKVRDKGNILRAGVKVA